MQEFSSKNTSINTISKIYKQYDFNNNSIILDYGCGKYDSSIDFMKEKNCTVLPYDKYNRSKEVNQNTINYCKKNHLDYIVCSNVLNVIKENNIIDDIIKDIFSLADNDTIVLFSIYEGDKTNIGKVTSKGYQRNEKYKNYIKILENYFEVNINKQIFICRKVIKNENLV